MRRNLNEAFDVLTWSRKNLTPAIANEIEEAHEGGYGEKLQTSLLKIMNKDELLKWYNKNFEVGLVEESRIPEVSDLHPWNQIYEKVKSLIEEGSVREEEQVNYIVKFFIKHGDYDLSPDDIEDAVWAAWSDSDF